MKKNNPDLAINGGIPVTKEQVIIHKPFLDEADFMAIDEVARSTFISGNGLNAWNSKNFWQNI